MIWKWLSRLKGLGRSIRNASVSFFSPDVRRREVLLEETPGKIEQIHREIAEKGFHVANVSPNVAVVRRKNGDRVVLFTKNLEQGSSPEVVEHFFPENWQRFNRSFDSTRHVGQVSVKGGTGRSYMLKTISPFRPIVYNPGEKHLGNTAFTEARILLDLQKKGFEPEVPVAVVLRPGYLPMLVTRFLPGTRMATWEKTLDLQKKIKQAGIRPNDLLPMDQQRLLVRADHIPRTNAVFDSKTQKTHPIDVEFYEYTGNDERRLRRLSDQSRGKLPLQGDPELRTWIDPNQPRTLRTEYRAFVPATKKGRTKEPGKWVPVPEAPDAPWKRHVVFDPQSGRWTLPEQMPDANAIDPRLYRYLEIDRKTGRVGPAKSLVYEIFSKP